jgi:hypothetical protein
MKVITVDGKRKIVDSVETSPKRGFNLNVVEIKHTQKAEQSPYYKKDVMKFIRSIDF